VRQLFMLITLSLFLYAETPFNNSSNFTIVGAVEESEDAKGGSVGRIMFYKKNGTWSIVKRNIPVESYYPGNWTLAFDGRTLGKIQLKDNCKTWDERCKWHRTNFVFGLKNPNHFPKIKDKRKRFGNWVFDPVYRPVIIVKNGSYKDRLKWKRKKADQNLRSTLFERLKSIIGRPIICVGKPNYDKPNFGYPKIDLTLSDIKIYTQYINNNGEMLVAAGLHDKHISNCDMLLSKEDYPIWFYINNKNNIVRFIDYELKLVDAADYDKDGRVEIIFYHQGYNRNGYLIYVPETGEKLKYYWGYT
jgi:hypothetical protein